MDKSGSACNHAWVTLRSPAIALVFFGSALLTRLSVMSRSVLDWDESVYFLMARAWAQGHLPYTTIWDNKPIGIYAIFAAFQAVFGVHVFAIRLATICSVALLAFSVFKITEILSASRAAAWLAGVALVLCSLSNDGLSANTELFMASFTALAVWAALATESGLVVGLLIGAAFMVKYVAVFEAPVILCLFMYRRRNLASGIAVVVGAAIPLALVAVMYALAGKFGLWLECSIFSNFRRAGAPFTAAAFSYALHTQLWRWGPLYAAGIGMIGWALFKRRATEIFLAVWLLGAMLGTISAKSFYDHYFLQVLPVLCVISGVWFAKLPRYRTIFVLVLLALPAWAAKTALQAASGPDIPREIAAALNTQHPQSLYVFDSQPIIYALTSTNPPTRYVLPSELTGVALDYVAGVNAQAEVARILNTNPQFIIRRASPPRAIDHAVYAELDQALTARYMLWRRFSGVALYRLK